MAMVAKRARITGRVQGVAFRAWTRDRAEQLGLSGWVRNEPDGSVRALFMGSDAGVAAMLDALKQGPPAARVSGVEIETVEPEAEIAGFRVVR